MVVRTADHAEVEEPWNMPVSIERRDASDVPGRVGALPRPADLFEIIVTFVGEIALAYFHHIAPRSGVPPEALLREMDRTALMIGS